MHSLTELFFILKFQFHKGAIRTALARGHHVEDLDFNSIKVRLELFRAQQRPQERRFQFHKGAIRTFCAFSNSEGKMISIP